MRHKLVSIIMSTYNESEEWLRHSIESILSQTYTNIEFVIVLDNPKNLVIKNIISEYQKQDSRIIVVENEKNVGLVASLNRALKFCNGDYIARMDADDIAISDRIEIEVDAIEKYSVDFVMGAVRLVDEEGAAIIEQRMGNIPPDKFEKCMRYGNISTHPTWLLKKHVYDELNGYRNIRYCEDLDFVLRAIQNGFRCYKLNDILLNYRIRANGISQSYAFEQDEKARFLRKNYRRKQKLVLIKAESINRQFEKYDEIEKEKYQKSCVWMDELSIELNKGNFIGCIRIAIQHFFVNKYFRKNFIDYARGYLVRIGR